MFNVAIGGEKKSGKKQLPYTTCSLHVAAHVPRPIPTHHTAYTSDNTTAQQTHLEYTRVGVEAGHCSQVDSVGVDCIKPSKVEVHKRNTPCCTNLDDMKYS